MTLDPRSIGKAIKDLESYKRELKTKLNDLIIRLTDDGAEIAKMQIAEMNAVYTGELQDSVSGYFSPTLCTGFIIAGAPYAMFVEFGSGVRGAGSPHPAPDGWKYDVNNHGDKGWWYLNPRDGKWHWTKGMPSRPFMYNTARILEAECARIAKEVFDR